MAFKLPRIPRGMMPEAFCVFWDRVCTTIETQENTQDDLLAAIIAAQDAADAAQAAADTAATAAANAQTAADNAQAAVDAIEVPPTGSRTVSTTQALTPDDYTIVANASGGAITLTLPAAAAAMNSIIVTKVDATANAVNVQPAGADNLNGGGAPVAITTQYSPRIFNSDGGSDWYG